MNRVLLACSINLTWAILLLLLLTWANEVRESIVIEDYLAAFVAWEACTVVLSSLSVLTGNLAFDFASDIAHKWNHFASLASIVVVISTRVFVAVINITDDFAGHFASGVVDNLLD